MIVSQSRQASERTHTLGTPMGIITVEAAPDFAVDNRRYVLASRPSADVASGVRRPVDMAPVMNAEVDPKNAVACPTARSAPTTVQNTRTMVLPLVLLQKRSCVVRRGITDKDGDARIDYCKRRRAGSDSCCCCAETCQLQEGA